MTTTDLGDALDAFILEHEYCGELDTTFDDDRVRMTCTCGAVLTHSLVAATGEHMTQIPSPKSKFYEFATIIFQARAVDGGWQPRCTIVYGLKGLKTEHVIEEKTLHATEQAADDAVFVIAKQWVDDYRGHPTSYSWGTRIDDESKSLWRELHEPESK